MLFRRFKGISPALGLRRLGHDLIHNRYRHRQLITVAYLFVISFLGQPWRMPALYWPAVAVIAVGMLVRLWASGHVKKDKTLATTGPYAYVRHPLYVGNHTIAFGFCMASGLWWSLPGWIALSLLYYPSAITHEDATLKRLFGADWEAWRARTKALIPRLTPYQRGQRGEWSLAQSWHNGEPVIIAVLCGLLYVLFLRLP